MAKISKEMIYVGGIHVEFGINVNSSGKFYCNLPGEELVSFHGDKKVWAGTKNELVTELRRICKEYDGSVKDVKKVIVCEVSINTDYYYGRRDNEAVLGISSIKAGVFMKTSIGTSSRFEDAPCSFPYDYRLSGRDANDRSATLHEMDWTQEMEDLILENIKWLVRASLLLKSNFMAFLNAPRLDVLLGKEAEEEFEESFKVASEDDDEE